MRKESSGFGKLIEFINSKQKGSFVDRSELLDVVYGFHKNGPSTIDKWRRQLVVCGYLKDTRCAGRYIVCQTIPEDITSSRLEKVYTETLYSPGYKDEINWNEKSYSKFCKGL